MLDEPLYIELSYHVFGIRDPNVLFRDIRDAWVEATGNVKGRYTISSQWDWIKVYFPELGLADALLMLHGDAYYANANDQFFDFLLNRTSSSEWDDRLNAILKRVGMRPDQAFRIIHMHTEETGDVAYKRQADARMKLGGYTADEALHELLRYYWHDGGRGSVIPDMHEIGYGYADILRMLWGIPSTGHYVAFTVSMWYNGFRDLDELMRILLEGGCSKSGTLGLLRNAAGWAQVDIASGWSDVDICRAAMRNGYTMRECVDAFVQRLGYRPDRVSAFHLLSAINEPARAYIAQGTGVSLSNGDLAFITLKEFGFNRREMVELNVDLGCNYEDAFTNMVMAGFSYEDAALGVLDEDHYRRQIALEVFISVGISALKAFALPAKVTLWVGRAQKIVKVIRIVKWLASGPSIPSFDML